MHVTWYFVHKICVSVCQPSVAENLAGGGNAPVVCCNLNSWACSASGWGSTWHLQVLHYSDEILNTLSCIPAVLILSGTMFLCTWMGVCVSTGVSVCVSWLVSPPLCVYLREEIIKSAGKLSLIERCVKMRHVPVTLYHCIVNGWQMKTNRRKETTYLRMLFTMGQ